MMWVVLAIASAIFISLVTVIEKKTLLQEHALRFSTILALFNLGLAITYLPQVDFSISNMGLFLILISSLIGAFAFLLMAKGIKHTEISLSTPLMNFGPAVTAVLAFIILGEGITFWQIIGIAIIVIGTYVVEVDHSVHHLLDPFRNMFKSKYILFILLSILLYGIGSIIDKHALNLGITPFTFLFFAHAFTAIYFLIFLSIYHNAGQEIVEGIKSSGKYIILCAIFITLSRIFLMEAMSFALVSLVLPIKRISTLFVTLFGGKFFHEEGLPLKVIGCCIMLIGVFLIAYPL